MTSTLCVVSSSRSLLGTYIKAAAHKSCEKRRAFSGDGEPAATKRVVDAGQFSISAQTENVRTGWRIIRDGDAALPPPVFKLSGRVPPRERHEFQKREKMPTSMVQKSQTREAERFAVLNRTHRSKVVDAAHTSEDSILPDAANLNAAVVAMPPAQQALEIDGKQAEQQPNRLQRSALLKTTNAMEERARASPRPLLCLRMSDRIAEADRAYRVLKSIGMLQRGGEVEVVITPQNPHDSQRGLESRLKMLRDIGVDLSDQGNARIVEQAHAHKGKKGACTLRLRGKAEFVTQVKLNGDGALDEKTKSRRRDRDTASTAADAASVCELCGGSHSWLECH